MHIKVSNRLMSLLRLYLCIILACIAFMCGILSVFSLFICVAVTIVSIFVAAVISFYYIPRLYRSYDVEITENSLIVNRGVFIRRRYIMPCPRLIYFERTQTIFSRIFGLYSVRVHAARARLIIPGLSKREAFRLTTLLSGESEQ